MPTVPEPTLVRLDPPGPYVTPAGVKLLDVVVATEESPAQLFLLLSGGAKLYIPLIQRVVEDLRLVLSEQAPEHPDIPQIGE